MHGKEPHPDAWLFSSADESEPLKAASLTAAMNRLQKATGLNFSMHSFRHYRASELHRMGVDSVTAAAELGHSVETMSRIYLHSSDDRQVAAGEAVSEMIVKMFNEAG
jgi:integrase